MSFKLFAILIINFSNSVGFGLVIPFLVILVKKFGGDALTYGIIGSVFPAAQFVGAPLLGRWSDHYGRKPILLISELGTLIGWLVFLWALFLPYQTLFNINGLIVTLPLLMIVIARAIDGLTGGNVSVAQAYLADVSDEKERSKNYGRLSAASNIGYVVGPGLAGILAMTPLGEKLPILFAVFTEVVALFFTYFYLPESFVGAKNTKEGEQKVSLFQIFKNPGINFLLVLFFLIWFGFSIYYTAFPVFVVADLGWSVGKMGLYFSALSLIMFVVQAFALSHFAKRFSEVMLIIFGHFLLGINFLLIVTKQDSLIYLSTVFFALGNGIMWPSMLSVLSKVAGPKLQGTAQGFESSMGSLASIVGLIAGGLIYQRIGGYSFVLTAAILYLVMILSFNIYPLLKHRN